MLLRFALALTVLGGPAALAQNCTHTWLGGDGHFNDASNWDPAESPSDGDTACIDADGTYTVRLSAARSAEERARFGTRRDMARLIVGASAGVQTVVFESSGFEGIGYPDVRIPSVDVRASARLLVPGGRFRSETSLYNAGTLSFSGEAKTVVESGVEITNDGEVEFVAIPEDSLAVLGRIENSASGELQWRGAPSHVEVESGGEIFNRGLVVASATADEGEHRLSGETRAAFTNAGGRLRVERGTFLVDLPSRLLGGEYEAASGATLSLSRDSELSGTLSGAPEGRVQLNGGTAVEEVILDLSGTIALEGRLSGVWRNQGRAIGDATVLSDGHLINEGEIVIQRGRFDVFGRLTNARDGVLALADDGASRGQLLIATAASSLLNRGLIVARGEPALQTSTVVRCSACVFVNDQGTLLAEEASLRIEGGPLELVGGTYAAENGNTLFLETNTLVTRGGLTGTGDVRFRFASSEQRVGDPVGVLLFDSPGLTVETGQFRGRWENRGHLVLLAGGFAQSGFVNKGTVTVRGSIDLEDAVVTNEAGARFDLDGDVSLRHADGLVINRGLLVKSAGEGESRLEPVVRNSGEVRALEGTVALPSLLSDADAVYSGTGAFAMADGFALSGTIAPGAGPETTGTLTWAGPLVTTGTSTLDIDLLGPVPGDSYDRLVVRGPATLDGELRVRVRGYAPEIGTAFDVVESAQLEGAFRAQDLQEGLSASVEPTLVRVSVTSPVANEASPDSPEGVEIFNVTAVNNPSRRPRVQLDLPVAAAVSVDLLDVRGRRVARLLSGRAEAGRHTLHLPALPAGLYLVRAVAGAEAGTTRLTVVR